MTRTLHLVQDEETKEVTSDRAIALTRTVATQASPGAAARLRHSVSVNYRKGHAIVRPVITTRVLRPPLPRGHRAFILAKQEWRR